MCGAVIRSEREQCAAQHAGYAAKNKPGPAMGRIANAVADGEDAGDGDETGRGVEESGVGGGRRRSRNF